MRMGKKGKMVKLIENHLYSPLDQGLPVAVDIAEHYLRLKAKETHLSDDSKKND